MEYREVIDHGTFFGFNVIEKKKSRKYSDYFISNGVDKFEILGVNLHQTTLVDETTYENWNELFIRIFKLLRSRFGELTPKTIREKVTYKHFYSWKKYRSIFWEFLSLDKSFGTAKEFVVIRKSVTLDVMDYIPSDYVNVWAKFEHFCYYDSPYATPESGENFCSGCGPREYYLVSLDHIKSNVFMKNYFEFVMGGIPPENEFSKSFIRPGKSFDNFVNKVIAAI